MIVMISAILGLLSVALGAYAEHGLREHITEDQFHVFMTALRYNQIHAAVATAIGLTALNGGAFKDVAALTWSGILFIAGILLFSGSIYASVLLDMPELTSIAPAGGMTLMGAWLLLPAAAWKAIKNEKEREQEPEKAISTFQSRLRERS